jgi:hypothetical protein
VAPKEDGLVLRIRGRDSILVPIKEDEWEVQPPDPLPLTVVVTRGATGEATTLTLKCGCGGFRTLRLVRVPQVSRPEGLTRSRLP